MYKNYKFRVLDKINKLYFDFICSLFIFKMINTNDHVESFFSVYNHLFYRAACDEWAEIIGGTSVVKIF